MTCEKVSRAGNHFDNIMPQMCPERNCEGQRDEEMCDGQRRASPRDMSFE
jgi:hypothetical protein